MIVRLKQNFTGQKSVLADFTVCNDLEEKTNPLNESVKMGNIKNSHIVLKKKGGGGV